MKPIFLTFLFLATNSAFSQIENYPTPPEAIRQENVAKGKLIQGTYRGSRIFPGTVRDYAVYVPDQYDGSTPASLMVFQDGMSYCQENRGTRAHIVFDNLIAKGEMPVTIAVFINPGVVPANHPDKAEARYNRSFEYDGLGDAYPRFLIEEFLPFIEKEHDLKISENPDHRGICGSSSGAIAAFTSAWERPDSFRRVYSMIGTYVGLRGGSIYLDLIRKTEPKPLRIFLQDGSNDNNIYGGDWWMANQSMQRSLEWAGYEVNHVWGKGRHNRKHGDSIFPDAMRWLWKSKTVSVHPSRSNSRASEYLIPGEDWKVLTAGHQWAEGMAFAPDGSLFFTDVPASKLYKISPSGEQSLIDADTGKTNGLAIGPDGLIYGASPAAKEIRTWDPATGERKTIFSGATSNDIVVRHDGHIYFTNPVEKKVHHLAAGSLNHSIVETKLERPNGIGLSADQSLLFVADFTGRFIYSYQINEDGSLKNRQKYFHAHLPDDGPGALDGMTVTANGMPLVATELGIQIFDQPGRVQLIIPRPKPEDKRTNYVAFGGPDRKTLYVATAGTIYTRKVNLKGADPLSPTKPPKPGL
ncbi:SMP-30/gluconolactonase/LRE family protein [Luteolibacter algae]|uniref:SMP-30/gluconolactonase/LRE family protein n=1 Tax=Luteolibacter algae TaxID=454151 RepID=A0ABW5D7J1_9BACT